MADLHFGLAFAEDWFTINGSRAVHLVVTAGEAATASILYDFDVTLRSTNGVYTKSFHVSMPQGSASVRIPYTVPLEWADDFAQNIGDTAHADACGQFCATMTAHYAMYAGTLCFQNDYQGYQAYLSATVDESILPTAGPLSAEAVDGKVPTGWQLWVQGISVARVSAAHAAGSCGSKIVAYTFGNGKSQTEPYADIPLPQSGNITIPVTVQDSRGRTATSDLYLAVQPYTPPALSGISSRRCDDAGNADEEGSSFLAVCTLSGSTLGGKNPLTVQCAWKKVTQDVYGPACTLTPDAPQRVAAGLETGASYDVKYTVADAFYRIDTYDYVSSTAYLLHFLKGGTGIAVGKAAEAPNLFDVALNTKLRRNANVGGTLSVTGNILLGGTDVGAALKNLGTITTANCTANTACLTAISENTAVKCGRIVLFRLHGTMRSGSGPTYEGERYLAATLPAGFFSTQYAPLAFACQNGRPCKAEADTAGRIYVVPAADGNEDTEICGMGIV